jgi:hypothetical protein
VADVRKSIPFALLVGAVYLGLAYAPVAETYFAVRYHAQKIANDARRDGRRPAHMRSILDGLRRETGLQVWSKDVRVDMDLGGEIAVSIDVRLPVHFPIIEIDRTHDVTVTATVPKPYR